MLRTLFLMDEISNCGWVTKWNFLTFGLVSFSSKFMFSDWNWRTPISDMWNLEESKLDKKDNWSWKERSSRHSDWTYSRNGRIEESSGIASRRLLRTKIERKSCDTMQRLFSQIQELPERVHEWFRRISGDWKHFLIVGPVQIFFVLWLRPCLETKLRPTWDHVVKNLWFANFYSVRAVLASGNFKAPPSSLVVCYNDIDRGSCLREQCTGHPDPNVDDTQVVK